MNTERHVFIRQPGEWLDPYRGIPKCMSCTWPESNVRVHKPDDDDAAVETAALRDRITGERDEEEHDA